MTIEGRPIRVLHVGKFYPPSRGGMERVVQVLCEAERASVDSQALVANEGPRTVRELVRGVPVTRVAALARVGAVALCPTFPWWMRKLASDIIVVHEPNPLAIVAPCARPPPQSPPRLDSRRGRAAAVALQGLLSPIPASDPLARRSHHRRVAADARPGGGVERLSRQSGRHSVRHRSRSARAHPRLLSAGRRDPRATRAAAGAVRGPDGAVQGVDVLLRALKDVDARVSRRQRTAQGDLGSARRRTWIVGARPVCRRSRSADADGALSRVRCLRPSLSDARRGVWHGAARSDGLRQACDQHVAAVWRAVGQSGRRNGTRRAPLRRLGNATRVADAPLGSGAAIRDGERGRARGGGVQSRTNGRSDHASTDRLSQPSSADDGAVTEVAPVAAQRQS